MAEMSGRVIGQVQGGESRIRGDGQVSCKTCDL